MKAVEVVWHDAFDMSGWMSLNDMVANCPPEQKGQLSRTRGWLHSEDEFKVVLAMTWAPDVDRRDEESMRGIMVIPRGMVVEIIDQEEIVFDPVGN
jgi:hypothetical protein